MANLTIKNAVGTTLSVKATGVGSDGDPHIVQHLETNSAAINTSLTTVAAWDSTTACKEVRVADVISVTPTMDTNAYASGDLLCDATVITAALRVSGGTAKLIDVKLIDEDDQGVAMDLYITSASTTWGTFNVAPTVSDTACRSVQAIIPIATGDWKDLGGARVAHIKNIQAMLKGAASANLYMALVNGSGTPTFTASGIKVVFGLEQN